MKERFLKVVKWFFIVLGVLFFIQLILLSGIVIGVNNSLRFPTHIEKLQNKSKNMETLIQHVKNYKNENGSYPKTLEGTDSNLKYEYRVFDNGNCFEIKLDENKKVKQYQNCAKNSNNSTFNSESYSEYIK